MRGPTPSVSVVIAAYNAARWIGDTIRSVLMQDYPVAEVIVVDDGSTDATRDIVTAFDPPVRYVYQENAGSAAARNAGIRLARGTYVAFLDADDLWLPGKLSAQIACLQAHPECSWCYTDAWLTDERARERRVQLSRLVSMQEGLVLQSLLLGNFVPFSSALVRREVLTAVGGFREGPDRRISEDWDLWLRVAAHHAVCYVARPLVLIRDHPDRKTGTVALQELVRARVRIVEEAVARHPALEPLRRIALAGIYEGAGRKALAQNQRAEARDLLGQALQLHPWVLKRWGYWLAGWLPGSVRRMLGWLRAQWWKQTERHRP
ncbi:MAG: glycosyltransferase [Rhodothermus sp.]|nr:glycosyltransferase [Rhodothermus sp.]